MTAARYILAWALYLIGDLVSRLPDVLRAYPVYTALMGWSDDIQGHGPGPWGSTVDESPLLTPPVQPLPSEPHP